MWGGGTHPNFILLGDALCNAYNEANLVLNCLNNGVCGMWRGDVEHCRVGLYFPNSLFAALVGEMAKNMVYAPLSQSQR